MLPAYVEEFYTLVFSMHVFAIVLLLQIQNSWAGCPFQNPFFFVDRPSVVTVVDSDGEMVADRFATKESNKSFWHFILGSE